MISREFIYEFSNFDDISTRENDKKSHAKGLKSGAIGVKCRKNLRSSTKQPLRLREMGVSCQKDKTPVTGVREMNFRQRFSCGLLQKY